MNEAEKYFEVERDLQEKLSNKYRHFTTNRTEFEFGSQKIQIQAEIYEEFLRISEEEAKIVFYELCTKLLKICYKYKVPCRQLNILILTDKEIDRGVQVGVQHEDGSYWRYIFIPPVDLRLPYAFLNYTFLHELGHCWINVQYDSFLMREVFTDLVSICALREIIPPNEKLYRDVIKTRSYIGGDDLKKYFGDKLQQFILQDPESHLKEFIKSI